MAIKVNKFKLSEYKKYIREHFIVYGYNYFDYYKHILLANMQYWHFINPNNGKCKDSFNCIDNNLKFMVLKKLIKQGYKLKAEKYNNKIEYDLTINVK